MGKPMTGVAVPLGVEVGATPWGERRGLTIGLLMVITLVAFEALAVATVLPAAQRDLGGLSLYGWSFSAFLLASLVGIRWAGSAADRVGPARPLAVGLGLFAVGLAVAGLAPHMAVLVAGRAIQGLGAGAVPAIFYVAIGRGYDEALRPRMLALASTAWVVPGLAGPGLAAAIAELTSWRLVFVGLLPLLALAAWLTLPALAKLGPPPGASDRPAASLLPALQLTLGAGLLLAGLTSGSLPVGALLAVAGAATALPALRRLTPPGTLRLGRGLPATIIGMGVLNFAFFGADAYIPYALTTVREEPVWVAGVVLTFSTVAWTAGSWAVERRPALDRRIFMTLGLALIAGATVATMFVLREGTPVLLVATAAWSAACFGMGMAYPNFSLTTLAHSTPGEEGVTTSALKLCETLGSALGTGLGGALIAAGEGAGDEAAGVVAAWALMAAVALMGIAVAWRTNAAGR